MKYKKNMKAVDVGIVDNQEYKFTWRQHFLPYSSMKRFCDENGKLNVINKLKVQVNFRKLDRYESGAVAARAWTQKTEKQIFNSIETSYFELSKSICSGQDCLTKKDHQTLTNYISLWAARFNYRVNDQKKHLLNGISEPQLTQHQVQNLEQRGQTVSGVIQSYELNSSLAQTEYDANRLKLGNVKWRIYRLVALDCILPDTVSNTLALPIAPNIVALPVGSSLDVMSKESISSLNLQLIDGSEEYYYAKDISRLIYC
ncbi:hypothetical protein [Salinivibrio kushneri]|uniref:Uncharacterized protein n=1 Tax=Salinivibrio kushneri TaxID=1908198 RepID=A0AA47LPV7_9GAMM|nr:hypothetical protein [Salinivibrio kushneri]WBA07773.1 hypothetical protein N8M53_07835 [Salinivibrio kushneri]